MSSRTQTGAGGSGGGLSNPVLVGSVIIVSILVAVFLSYNANRGLPFVKTFDLTARVPDAAELVAGSEVRIGGFRVGQVNKIEAQPAKGDKPPYADLTLALDGDVDKIPKNTIVRIRPRSLLGSKYVELTPGDSRDDLASGGTLPLSQSRKVTEIDETFNTFDPRTRRGLQGTIRGLGDAVAGRGDDLNRAITATSAALPPLQRVTTTLADPRTRLGGFVDGLASAMGALAPVAAQLGAGLGDGATTLAAVDRAGNALESALELLPGTESAGTAALTRVAPVVRDFADIAVALQPGVRRLPRTTRELTRALVSGTRTLGRTRQLTRPLRSVLTKLDAITTDVRAPSALRGLTATVTLLKPTLDDLTAAQTACNVGGLLFKNLTGTLRRGDADGTWLSTILLLNSGQQMHAAEPAPDLHYNPYPVENAQECEAGNEPFTAGRAIGNPAGTQPNTAPSTTPPDGALDRARAAGLLDPVPGADG